MLVIGVGSPPESQSIFQVAVLRTEETTLGAIVYILVAAFIWPTSSVGMFSEACRKLWATQTQLYRSYRGLISGKGTAADSRPLRAGGATGAVSPPGLGSSAVPPVTPPLTPTTTFARATRPCSAP